MTETTFDEFDHESHIRDAIRLAHEAADRGDFPFGSVLVRDDTVVISESNRERTEDDEDFSSNDRPIAPFARILAYAIAPGDDTLSEHNRDLVTDLTVDIIDHIAQEIDRPDFWRTGYLQNQLRSWVIRRLDDADVLPYDKIKSAADDIMQTAEANHEKLTR